MVGAPGVDKTRMALHIVSEIRERFPNGVWLVETVPPKYLKAV